jgi:hypothetical protein
MTLRAGAVCALAFVLMAATDARAYSVLAHEALIDAAWDDAIAPRLRRRFPRASPQDVRAARAFAYGGSLIQDMGYYPFGSKFFSNLVHYIRSGDFVEALIRESRDVNEYAFALGALAHYASDNLGHPGAVNRAVPIIYPKLKQEYGSEVLYAHSPSRHVMVEFAFDVVQAARGAFKSDVYQQWIGFEVPQPLLDRAFRDTYGLALADVFGDVELAIGTYRRAASEILPDVTRLAWRDKKDEILQAMPGVTEQQFVFAVNRQQYDEKFGRNYRKPGFLARMVIAIFKVLPKFGPFKPLAFEPLTPETERMFLESFAATRTRYGALLQRAGTGSPALADTDLDTGASPMRGVNPLADETYGELLKELAAKNFAGTPAPLRASINAHFAAGVASAGKPSRKDKEAARYLAALNATVLTGTASK